MLAAPGDGSIKKIPGNLEGKGSVYDMINEANALAVKDPDLALTTITSAMQQSLKTNDPRAQAHCFLSLGTVNFNLERYSTAAENYRNALERFRDVDDPEGLYYSVKHLAISLDAQGSQLEALLAYGEALEIARVDNSIEEQIELLSNIGRIHYNRAEYTRALTYYSEAESLEDNDVPVKEKIATYNELGKVYEELNDTSEALRYYEQGRALAEESNDQENISNYYSNVSELSLRNQNTEQAINFQEQAVQLNRRNNNPVLENAANLKLANIHLQTDNSSEAIPYLQRALDLSNTLGEIQSQKEAYKGLSEAYESLGFYEKALESYKSYVTAADSFIALREADLLNRLQLSEELNARDQEIELLVLDQELDRQRISNLEKDQLIQKASNQRQRILKFTLATILILLAVSATLIYLGQVRTKEANRQLALQNLRGQMNPHFIFNALNSVNNFIASNDERSANKYLSEFSRLMRQVLNQSKANLIPLHEEVEVLERYLDLEHLRFPDLFDYSVELDDSISDDSISIPPMLIQPFIENSIWHGLRYREESGGTLKLRFSKNEEFLLVEIKDNGIGRKRSAELKTQNQKQYKSTAMSNIEERLRLLSEKHKKEFTVEISDASPGSEYPGTRVELKIPLKIEVA